MGLNDPKTTNKIYLNIVGGQLARRFKEHQPEENGKPVTFDRVIKNKQTGEERTVIERYYESVDGLITNAEIDASGDFGSRLVFDMMDDGEEFTVQIPVDSSYGRSILLRIPNINPEIPVKLQPFDFENKEAKRQTGITVYQKNCDWEDDKVPYKWTKENPGSLPDWESKIVAGKTKWDSSEQTNFLCKHFEQWARNVAVPVPTEQSNVDKVKEGFDAEEPEILEMEKQYAEEQATKQDTPPPSIDEAPPVDDDLPF